LKGRRTWDRRGIACRGLTRTALPATLLTLLLTGCGGGSHVSLATWTAREDADCHTLTRETSQLPELERTQHLTYDELKARADQYAARFSTASARVQPPASVAAAVRRLRADATATRSLDGAVATAGSSAERTTARRLVTLLRRVKADYLAAALPGCATDEQGDIDSVQAAIDRPAVTARH
jgi:NAD(P)-dependent dehydrogenase (short-subunit alcohol dehydrogenase family)